QFHDRQQPIPTGADAPDEPLFSRDRTPQEYEPTQHKQTEHPWQDPECVASNAISDCELKDRQLDATRQVPLVTCLLPFPLTAMELNIQGGIAFSRGGQHLCHLPIGLWVMLGPSIKPVLPRINRPTRH